MAANTMFKLKRPCAHCPFRCDVPGYLRRSRAIEIATDLANGSIFPCHETTVDHPDDESERIADADSQFCAGALLAMENEESPNQAMRMAERLGLYDAAGMDRSAPVVGSLAEFVLHHTEEPTDDDEGGQEPCSVAEHGCEAPAGYMVGGSVIPADPDGETRECPSCGNFVCYACSDDNGVCAFCTETGDE